MAQTHTTVVFWHVHTDELPQLLPNASRAELVNLVTPDN